MSVRYCFYVVLYDTSQNLSDMNRYAHLSVAAYLLGTATVG